MPGSWTPTNPDSEIHILDGSSQKHGLAKTTHLGIGAHQDDLEIIAVPGILTSHSQPNLHFSGVIVSNGSGAPRGPGFEDYSESQYIKIRNQEQIQAANIGQYQALILLGYQSSSIRNPLQTDVPADLTGIIELTSPEIIYTHNPFDRHPTHAAVCFRTIAALRELPESKKPSQVFGLACWRDLDWLAPDQIIPFDCSDNQQLQRDLLDVFQSQNAGKAYTEGVLARRKSGATFYNSHQLNQMDSLVLGLDLTPLIDDPQLDLRIYLDRYLKDFYSEILDLSDQLLGR
jgi:LmbE family N-acetylglucosaminyl deacetylase